MYNFVLGDQRTRLVFMILLFLSLSALDLLGIGLIGPFVGAILDPAQLTRFALLENILFHFAGNSTRDQIFALGIILLMVFVFKGVAAYFVQRTIFSFSFSFRTHLIKKLMHAYLGMPYRFYLERNSSTIVQSVIAHTKVMSDDLLTPSLRFVADTLMLLVLGLFLLWVSPSAIAMLGLMLGSAFFFFIRFVKPRVRKAGEQVGTTNERMIRGVNQGMGGVKEIRVLRAEKSFFADVADAAEEHSAAQLSFNSMLVIPRYLMETVIVLFVILFSLVMTFKGEGSNQLIPVLAIFGAAGMRILPAMSTISSSLASMHYSSFSLAELYRDLKYVETHKNDSSDINEQRVPSINAVSFERLVLKDVHYAYANAGRPAVDGMSFVIESGQSIGLIGESGAGKTTIVDILLGLHPIDSGSFTVNGISIEDYGWDRWRDQIAYIPQNIFLTDDTLAQNVAFGVPKKQIDIVRVRDALKSAQLSMLLDRLPAGLQTVLGERGVRLSGGERQRVALARAFYHNRNIFVFDEATSALDIETEQQVIDIIDRLHGEKTMIVIAHRLTTVKGCDVVHRLKLGRIVASGRFEEVIGE